MGKWARARSVLRVCEWFRAIPDFILTFDASYASICSDAHGARSVSTSFSAL